MLRWKLEVLQWRLLNGMLLAQRLLPFQKLRKLIEEEVATGKFMFQSL